MPTEKNPFSIQVEDLDFTYSSPDRPKIDALLGMNLSVRDEEFVSLVGPSGCGKTTFLKLLCGLISPDKGKIRIKGLPPLEARQNGRFSVVFQSTALLEWRTVEENIFLPIELHSELKTEHQVLFKDLMKMVGLEDFSNSYPHELSGGMQQKVAIARSLINQPSALFMDEPFGALDLITRGKLNLELQRIWGKIKPSVVFITHSIREACFLSDKIAVMSTSPGRITKIFDVNFERPRSLEIFQESDFISLETNVSKELGNSSIL